MRLLDASGRHTLLGNLLLVAGWILVAVLVYVAVSLILIGKVA